MTHMLATSRTSPTPREREHDRLMDELARRVRAARSYAGLTQEDMASRLGISIVTYKRLEQGHRSVTLEETKRISEITQMPLSFFSADLSQMSDPAVAQQQLADVQGKLEHLVDRLADLEYRMRQTQEE
jgi:putative transcriptional regulator